MLTYENKIDRCNICRHEHTTNHVEAMPGIKIFVCDDCLEAAKHNFIFICMNCGKVYLRPKKFVIDRLNIPELKSTYQRCEDMQLIQGLDICIECDPDGIAEYMNDRKMTGTA